jgi:hypothetical protein
VCVAFQVSESETEESLAVPTPGALCLKPTAAADAGRIIAVTAYACRSPGGAISSFRASDAITTTPLQVGVAVCSLEGFVSRLATGLAGHWCFV